jgi:hypothetical protein
MAEALEADREKFERITKEHDDIVSALTAVLQGAFELSEHEVQRNRLLVSEQVLVGVHRTSAREEQARQLARSRTRDLEFVWATFLTRGMEQGAIPEADPRLLARAILGLYNSVFHWYRPGGDLGSLDVADFYVQRCLAVAGLPMDVVARRRDGPGKAKSARSRGPAADGQARPTRGSGSPARDRHVVHLVRARRRSGGCAPPREARRGDGPATRPPPCA